MTNEMAVKQLVRKMAAESGEWDSSGYSNHLPTILVHWLGARVAWMKLKGPRIQAYCYDKESADKIVQAVELRDFTMEPWPDEPPCYSLTFSFTDLVTGDLVS